MSSAPLLPQTVPAPSGASAGSENGAGAISRQASLWRTVDSVFPESGELDESTFGPGKREYYRRQQEMQAALRDVDRLLAQGAGRGDGAGEAEAEMEAKMRREAGSRMDQIAVSLSNATNILLFFLKLYASVATHSLAIIASTLDSLLDILAGGILWYTSTSMAQHDPQRYPVGKRRMQPVGIMVFASVMATLGFQVLLEGVGSLLRGPGPEEEKVSPATLHWVLLLLSLVVLVKFGLFLLCRASRNDIVQAYATDHFMDVLSNSIGLLSALLGHRVPGGWWMDPCGAIAIALYTIINWSRTVVENAESLIGLSAPPELLAKLIHVTLNHDSRIVRLESMRAWLLGSQYIVEIDIELPGDMLLREAHDIGEALQNKVEALPEVDRAFVHLDYDSIHPPEHGSSGRWLLP